MTHIHTPLPAFVDCLRGTAPAGRLRWRSAGTLRYCKTQANANFELSNVAKETVKGPH